MIGRFWSEKQDKAKNGSRSCDRGSVSVSGSRNDLLGMRVNTATGVKTLLGFGPRIAKAAQDVPCHEPRGCAEGTHDRGREGMATARHRRSASCQGRSVAAASTVTGTGGRPGGAGIRRQKAARGSAERVRPREQAAPRSPRRRQGRQGHLERVGGQTILTHQLAHGGEQTGRRPVAFGSKTGSKIALRAEGGAP